MKSWPASDGQKITRVLSGRSNVFLLTNGQKNLLIDTSPGYRWKKLSGRLEKLLIEQIDVLVLTHSHFDHAANAAMIREKYNAAVIIHESEASFLIRGDNILPDGTNFFTKFLVRTFAKHLRLLEGYQPCIADITINDYYDLSAFGFNAYLMHTPGHSQGSISVIVNDEIALVGDTMFGIFPGSIFPPFASEQGQMLESWARLLETKCKLFIPSHGSANKRALVQKDLYKRKSQ